MPRECMFCICVCAGTDMRKMNENKAKTDKNKHENGKCQKPQPGKQNDQGKLKLSLEVLRDSESFNSSPWAKFEELAVSVPAVSDFGNNSPLMNI